MERFCKKCMILLHPKDENNEIFLECTNCGFKEAFTDWVEHTCNSCNHDKATILYHEMIKGDEGTTTMYRCIKCGATDKDGYKGG